MNENTIYWIWLARTLGAGAKIGDIISFFGSPRQIYEAGSREWRISGILTARQIQALSAFSPSQCGDILQVCRANGWRIVTPEDTEYPNRLLQMPDYPAVLFVWGDETVLADEVMLSVVGTRKASAYSVRVTEVLATAFGKAGATVVSGGALGVDSAAHWGALKGGGKTIAVLGCGLGVDYLRENENLRREVAKHGAVVTEFFPFTPASRTTFPMRNRLISGLSLGTVVVEAGERSGSLITARLALEQGRDVFAVPGDVITSAFTGTNRLIHDGAKPVFTALDVLEEYYYTYPQRIKLENTELPLGVYAQQLNIKAQRPVHNTPKASSAVPQKRDGTQRGQVQRPPEGLTKNAEKIYQAIGEAPIHIDDISERTGLPVSQTLAALTELELLSLVTLAQGKMYQKI